MFTAICRGKGVKADGDSIVPQWEGHISYMKALFEPNGELSHFSFPLHGLLENPAERRLALYIPRCVAPEPGQALRFLSNH